MRSNPLAELERLFERLQRQIDSASRDLESGEPFDLLMKPFGSMAADLVEEDDEFVVTVDLPGFDRDEVDVRVADHSLTIDAEHAESSEAEEKSYLRRERRRESMHRSIHLPAEVDSEGVSARMKNGVLTITLPKVETDDAKQIEIE
jgi:HSP20 family protein